MGKYKEQVTELMFNYEEYEKHEIEKIASNLPRKIIRWLAINHPDNRTRKIFYRMTNITIGKGVMINNNFIVSDDYKGLLIIGDRVSIAPNVTVICSSAPNNSRLQLNSYVKEKMIKDSKVIIEQDVWIGTNVTILGEVTIGEGSIIGAGTVVTKDIPPFSIVKGVPGEVFGQIK